MIVVLSPALSSRHDHDVATTSRLFNPAGYDAAEFDPATRASCGDDRLVRGEGQRPHTAETHSDEWYGDFIEFLARERAFATLLTPARDAGGDPDKRWDTRRNATFNEILGFYGLPYWYAWQVTILGLGPIWQSDNDGRPRARRRAARRGRGLRLRPLRARARRRHLLDRHGADARRRGGFRASGGKYYIGNGNVAGMVSVFGRRADVEGPDGYVFFAADSAHPNYKLIKNVVHGQMYVSAFDLDDYPVAAEDVLHTGVEAFEAALNTINVGKFNLGFCAIGMAEHCFYETVTQAENRVLFGKRVTEFGQVRRILSRPTRGCLRRSSTAPARSTTYAARASSDRRYLLYTPINKMRVTMEGERIVRLLGEVISAKGFENDSYFEIAKTMIGGLPKLEGTVHVNLALTLKFLPELPVRRGAPRRRRRARLDTDDDAFLFAQGPTRGLGKIRFPDWRPVFDAHAERPERRPLPRAGGGARRARQQRR